MKKSHLLLFVIFVAFFSLRNYARFDTKDANLSWAEINLQWYLDDYGLDSAEAMMEVVDGYPRRFPKEISNLWNADQIVWEYDWNATFPEESLTGKVSILPNGQGLVNGHSSIRGHLGLSEF